MASTAVDNLIAMKVLYMLVQPYDKTEAFKLGVIDKDGTLLVKSKDQTSEQRAAYDYLDRLVFNIKRLIGKLPGGKSMFASMVAALYLVKEDKKLTVKSVEERFNYILNKIEKHNISLVEEEIMVEKFVKELEEDGGVGAAPANATGSAVSTDKPVIKKKPMIARRPSQFKGSVK